MIEVRRSGLLTTIQDEGRIGSRSIGVPVSGAADALAMRTANLLIGNDSGMPVLEMTMTGAALYFRVDALVCLCGGTLEASAGGTPVPYGRPVWLRAGTLLDIGYAREGCRAYLAVAGGFRSDNVLGSASTYVQGGFGGQVGRALAPGDTLVAGSPSPSAAKLQSWLAAAASARGQSVRAAGWALGGDLRPDMAGWKPVLRAVSGPEAGLFDAPSRDAFWSGTFRMTPHSDRMGCRLEGTELRLNAPYEMVSEAVAPGAVQVPPNGQPVLLLADCQTTGGYPRIAHVAAADLPLAAQLKPGDSVSFARITLEEAQELYAMRETELRLLAAGMAAKIQSLQQAWQV